MEHRINFYQKGMEKIEADFDMYNYIRNMRELDKIKAWIEKYKYSIDPDSSLDKKFP